jgi:fructose-1,6-bisphosphatase/inositol monophosphatase family enzyme
MHFAMAEVATGIYDGIISYFADGSSWDVAGGTYLLQANNCFIIDSYGNNFDFRNPKKGIIAFNKNLDNDAINRVRENFTIKHA